MSDTNELWVRCKQCRNRFKLADLPMKASDLVEIEKQASCACGARELMVSPTREANYGQR